MATRFILSRMGGRSHSARTTDQWMRPSADNLDVLAHRTEQQGEANECTIEHHTAGTKEESRFGKASSPKQFTQEITELPEECNDADGGALAHIAVIDTRRVTPSLR